MPMYEYECPSPECGQRVALRRAFAERDLPVLCPNALHLAFEGRGDCEEMRLVVSVPGVAHVEGGTGASRSAR
jgi:putative FmdB family regulatory protein